MARFGRNGVGFRGDNLPCTFYGSPFLHKSFRLLVTVKDLILWHTESLKVCGRAKRHSSDEGHHGKFELAKFGLDLTSFD